MTAPDIGANILKTTSFSRGQYIMNNKLIGSAILTGSLAFSAMGMATSSGGDFVITKSTIDAGGGVSVGSNFKITGTIGQHDATIGTSAGGQFRLAGGFWGNSAADVTGNMLFKDSFENN